MSFTIIYNPRNTDFPKGFTTTPIELLTSKEIIERHLPIIPTPCKTCCSIFLLSELQNLFVHSQINASSFNCPTCRHCINEELFYPLLKTSQKIFLWFSKNHYQNTKSLVKILFGLVLFFIFLYLKKFIDPFNTFYLDMTHSILIFSLSLFLEGISKFLPFNYLSSLAKGVIIFSFILAFRALLKEIFLL